MSADHNTIVCTHGLGLKCRICYDQRYGLDWDRTRREMGLDDKVFTKNLVECEVKVTPPAPAPRPPYYHPFLTPLSEE